MFSNNTQEEVRKKITILHILSEFNLPLTNDQATEFILEHNLLNYFELQQYLSDLVKGQMIEVSESDDDKYFVLSEKGRDALSFFDDRLDQAQRQHLNDLIETKKKRFVVHTRIFADYQRLDDDDFLVHLRVNENDTDLIDLKLTVVSNEHAKLICRNWKNNAQFLYGDILGLLVSEN